MTRRANTVGPDPIDMHVGQRIRETRCDRGLSQQQLGEMIGLTFQQIQKYERGANRVASSNLWRIARALRVPVDYFFRGLEDGEEIVPIERPRRSMELVRNFEAIPDDATQKGVYDLVKSLSTARLRGEGRPEAAE